MSTYGVARAIGGHAPGGAIQHRGGYIRPGRSRGRLVVVLKGNETTAGRARTTAREVRCWRKSRARRVIREWMHGEA